MVAAFESHQPLPCRRCLSSPGDGSRNGFAGKLGGDGERTRAIPPPSIAEGCTAAGTVHIRGHGIDAAGPFRGIGWGRAGAWLVGNGTPDRTRRTHARTHRQTQQEQKTKCRRSRAGRDGSERATKHRQRHQSAIRQRPLDRQTSEQAMVRPLSQSMGTRDSLPAYHAAHGAFC
ncbi:unnamed protein product [Pseudo-nitzschia multistriata]|uniref:Uncharacterized protein n=1 Tax=Pseudo-nitzschia multistriata TaxID=183589 RepID=A0A448ZDK1_9STRA|nr:unnamed protein product [Pseudo-nitzschia multistriata]